MEVVRNKRVLITGNSHYRVVEPYTKLKCDNIEFVFMTEQTRRDDAWNFDAVVIPMPIDKELPFFIRDYTEAGKVVVIDTDDDIFSIPPTNPAFKEFNRTKDNPLGNYKQCLQGASYIHCSTPELKKTLNPYKTVVFENGIDFDKYKVDGKRIKEIFRKSHNIPEGNKIVMWMGSPTHVGDLTLIYPVLRELLKRSDITVVLCSDIEWLRDIGFKSEVMPNVITLGWVPFDVYTQLPAVADVFLCPLADNKFNACKSELKIMESAVWCTPCVTSSVAPYQRFHQLSETGGSFMVRKERLNLWLEGIDTVMNNSIVAESIGEKAYLTVKENYDLKIINEKRKLWWEKVLS